MKITGKKTRSLAEREKVSFSVSGSINNITGSGVFGLSGATNDIKFLFQSGRIYDPEGKYFSSYVEDESFSISGNISGAKYDYYINNAAVNLKGSRTNEKVDSLFFDATGCELDLYPIIKSDPYPYNITFPSEFLSGYSFSGSLNAEGTTDKFEIFSGVVNYPSAFSFTGFQSGPRTTANIELKNNTGISLLTDYEINFTLHTNFGSINKTVTGKSVSEESARFNGTDFSITGGNNFSQTGLNWNYYNTSTGNYNLNYTLVRDGVELANNKEISIKLTNNLNSSGSVKTGYVVTGVQMRGKYQNGFFLDTPVVTFSSNNSVDVQASGTALMADYMVADFHSGVAGPASGMSGIVVKTVTGIQITNSGSYVTPTGINISFSHPSTEVFFPNPCNYYKYTRLPLQASTAGLQYQLSTERKHWYYDNSRADENLYETELNQTNLGCTALSTSGTSTYNRELTGIWQLVTGIKNGVDAFGFNLVDGPWGSGLNEKNHPDGVKVNGAKEYEDLCTTDEPELLVRLKCHLPKEKVAITQDNELTISPDTEYYQSNFGTCSVKTDFYNHYPELKSLISGTLYSGGTGAINLSYSFIKSGTTGQLPDGTTLGVYQDIAYTSAGSEPSLSSNQVTGEIVSAFSEWKGLLENVYTGLTINFSNNGLETSTSVPVKIGQATYAMPNSEDSSIGDIRIGFISGDSSSLGWTIVTGGKLNISGDEVGDISLNNQRRYRLDADSANTGTCYSLKYLACHEIGHSLGFSHDRDRSGIMYYNQNEDYTFSVDYPSGLSGSFRNQDLVKNFYSYTKNPWHEKLKEKQLKGHRDKMSVNLYISGSGQSPINQIISGVTPSGYTSFTNPTNIGY
tara:strand:+ start:10518 stop:13082 length:2565 start_codon:yes stop_codon:yes gene_type:complete